MEYKKRNITRLIASAVLGIKLSAEEQHILDEWLKSNRNQRIFEKVKTLHDADDILELERKSYPNYMANRVLQQIKEDKKHPKYHWIKWISGMVATFTIIILMLTWNSNNKVIDQPLAQSELTKQIVPGKVEAIFTFANGEKLRISDTTDIKILQNNRESLQSFNSALQQLLDDIYQQIQIEESRRIDETEILRLLENDTFSREILKKP